MFIRSAEQKHARVALPVCAPARLASENVSIPLNGGAADLEPHRRAARHHRREHEASRFLLQKGANGHITPTLSCWFSSAKRMKSCCGSCSRCCRSTRATRALGSLSAEAGIVPCGLQVGVGFTNCSKPLMIAGEDFAAISCLHQSVFVGLTRSGPLPIALKSCFECITYRWLFGLLFRVWLGVRCSSRSSPRLARWRARARRSAFANIAHTLPDG